jgi:uncharacterized protein (DUF427 family)
MSLRVRDALMSGLDGLRHEPTAKRIRAVIGGTTVVDSVHAVLLWEPRRIVASYAVPERDIRADLRPAGAAAGPADDAGHAMPDLSARPVLDPSIPFGMHTADGEPLDVLAGGHRRPGAAFRLADAQLAGYAVLDFGAFDGWFEEDEPTVAHPRDPFHRIDVLAASRHVRVELDGEVLADSARPTLLFETMLPTRYYLPRADVRGELVPSPKRSFCAYKGQASYLTLATGDRTVPDVAWTYPHPLHEAAAVRGLVCFFDEHVDVVVDGARQQRPMTPWSRR